METEAVKYLSAALAVALGGIAPALSEGYLAAKALSAIGRNPEASDKIRPLILATMAIIESIAIYALVVALLILFVS